MYGEFADPYDLAECKLAILHCAGHYDTVLIETLWAAIIDRGMSYAIQRLAKYKILH